MPENGVEEGLLNAAVETLRPLARRLIEEGVPFGRLESRLREMFVRVAEHDLAIPGRPQTDSRVALLTGINRKEVRRIRSENPGDSAPRTFSRNLAATLVSIWLTDDRATDRQGRPRPIPYQSQEGPSFVDFARQATADLPPRAILDELVRTGAAEVSEDKTVGLRADAYIPKIGEPEKLVMLSEDPRELIETMLRNIFASDESELCLQRKVSYDNLGSDGISEIRSRLRKEGEQFIRRVNAILAVNDRDRNPAAPGGEETYASIGVYYFEAPAGPPDEREG